MLRSDLVLALSLLCGSCGVTGGGIAQEDFSVSGSVAALVGGAYHEIQPSSELARLTSQGGDFVKDGCKSFWGNLQGLAQAGLLQAFASQTACPTFSTAVGGNSCAAAGSGAVTLLLAGCSMNGAAATWSPTSLTGPSGIPGIKSLLDSSGKLFCGAASDYFTRSDYSGSLSVQFNNVIRASQGALQTDVWIDTVPGNLTQDQPSWWVNQSAFMAYPMGGVQLTLQNGVLTQISIPGKTLVASRGGVLLFKHTLTTRVPGTTVGATAGTTRDTPLAVSGNQVSGVMTAYHDLVRVLATSEITQLRFSSGCCLPTGGQVTTRFTAIPGVSPLSGKYANHTEVLRFTGCGSAIYSGPEGYGGPVKLVHCL